MSNEKERSLTESFLAVINRRITDETIGLRVVISSGMDEYIQIEDIEDEFRNIAVPRSVEGIDKLIALLEKAKNHI